MVTIHRDCHAFQNTVFAPATPATRTSVLIVSGNPSKRIRPMPGLPRQAPPLHRPKLTLSVRTKVEDRDNECRVCHRPDRAQFIGTRAARALGPLPENAVDLFIYIIRAVMGRDYTTSDVCRLCRECMNAVRNRTVGIAGDADEKLAICDARDDLPL